MEHVLGVALEETGERRPHNLNVRFFDAGEEQPANLQPHPRYAQTGSACRECGMRVADDDYELIDSMTEDELSEPGVVLFRVPDRYAN